MQQLDPYTISTEELEELRERHGLSEDAPLSAFPEFADFFRAQSLSILRGITGDAPMSKAYILSAVIPDVEPLTYKDDRYGGDGTVYNVRRTIDLGLTDQAELRIIKGQYQLAVKEVNTAKQRQQARAAAEKLERATNELMQFLIPDLPMARIEAVPLMERIRFLGWWLTESRAEQKASQDKEDQAGEAKAPQQQPRTRRGKRSRNSSPVTA